MRFSKVRRRGGEKIVAIEVKVERAESNFLKKLKKLIEDWQK